MDTPSALLFAQELGAKAFIVGQMSVTRDNALSIALQAYRIDNGKGIAALQVSFRLDKEMASLSAENTSAYDFPADFSSYPASNAGGYSAPRCIYCPRADYSREAVEKRIEGTVELVAIVGADGSVEKVEILKGLPDGLNVMAIRAIKKWKLQPAIGPDGKPVAVRQTIEVAFRL
ncbi:MAG TPA: energy transducer TonB [Candidatus Acidoferrales bacterium]|nr:energy transducer TonB [Candidatus Acidoferrales bacterium]